MNFIGKSDGFVENSREFVKNFAMIWKLSHIFMFTGFNLMILEKIRGWKFRAQLLN